MSKTEMMQVQKPRMEEMCAAHKRVRELHAATEEAIRCHDKYVAAMDDVMRRFTAASDAMERVRTHLDAEEAAAVPSTCAAAESLAAAHSVWRTSAQQLATRAELEELHTASTMDSGKFDLVKQAMLNVKSATVADVAARCADPAAAPITRQERESTKLAHVNNAITSSMTAMATVWATMLTAHGTAFSSALARLSGDSVDCFATDTAADFVKVL